MCSCVMHKNVTLLCLSVPGHPSCLELTDEMVKVVRTYPWQCMECKTCVQCMDPYDEVNLIPASSVWTPMTR